MAFGPVGDGIFQPLRWKLCARPPTPGHRSISVTSQPLAHQRSAPAMPPKPAPVTCAFIRHLCRPRVGCNVQSEDRGGAELADGMAAVMPLGHHHAAIPGMQPQSAQSGSSARQCGSHLLLLAEVGGCGLTFTVPTPQTPGPKATSHFVAGSPDTANPCTKPHAGCAAQVHADLPPQKKAVQLVETATCSCALRIAMQARSASDRSRAGNGMASGDEVPLFGRGAGQ